MATCTFLGHKEVHDKDIYEKLARAVYGLVEEHDEAEFLFYNQGTFYDLCLAAVLEARQRFPQKRISITWVVPAEERERFAADLAGGRGNLPPCVADRVAAPPPVSGSPVTAHKKIERWTIQQSTHLISYLYFAFCAPENRQYFYARAAGLTVLDMTSPETAARILEGAAALPGAGGAGAEGRAGGAEPPGDRGDTGDLLLGGPAVVPAGGQEPAAGREAKAGGPVGAGARPAGAVRYFRPGAVDI